MNQVDRPRTGAVLGTGASVALATAISVVGTSLFSYAILRRNIQLPAELRNLVPSLAAWPFGRPGLSATGHVLIVFATALVIAVVVAAVLAALGALGAVPGRGVVTVAMTSWFASVLGGATAGLVAGLVQRELVYGGRSIGLPWWYGANLGAYWGLVVGWFAALLGALAFGLLARPRRHDTEHVTPPEH